MHKVKRKKAKHDRNLSITKKEIKRKKEQRTTKTKQAQLIKTEN